jgi:NADH dehydrogenase/NADH:ubiquinone oxidoreductase subunit G
VDEREVEVADGATILKAIAQTGISTPTLCYDPVMRPVNVCRVCVVELKGARALVPACSRVVEPGMQILTDSPRVRQARRVVLELLQSSVDTSTAPDGAVRGSTARNPIGLARASA